MPLATGIVADPSYNSAVIRWSFNTSLSTAAGLAGFTVHYYETSRGSSTAAQVAVEAGSRRATLPRLKPATGYSFFVVSEARVRYDAATSATMTFPTDADPGVPGNPLDAPQRLRAVPRAGSVTLTCEPPSTNTAAVGAYQWYFQGTGLTRQFRRTSTPTFSPGVLDTSLTYQWGVRAIPKSGARDAQGISLGNSAWVEGVPFVPGPVGVVTLT